jgi:outer membrane beta-barrel protein
MSLPAPRSRAGRLHRTWRGGKRPSTTPSCLRACAALGLLISLAAPAAPRAQSKSDAFAGKIPPVSAALYRKAERWEATVSGNFSVNDAFYSKYFGALKLGYHFTESLSATGFATMGLNTKAGSAQVCPSGEGCRSADRVEMWQVPGSIRYIAGVEGAWAPVYGKLNLFSEQVAHFDLSLILGADWINHQEVLGRDEAEALALAGGEPGTTSTIGAHVGLGVRVFFSEWVALRLEFRDYMYQVEVPNVREGSGASRDLQHQLFTEIGVSFFFPTRNRPVQ